MQYSERFLMDIHPMMEEQVALEAEMRDMTRSRYFRTHEKAEEREDLSSTHAGRNLLDHIFDPTVTAVEAWVSRTKAAGAGRRPKALTMIEEFGDTRTLTYIFLRHLINCTLTLSTYQRMKSVRTTRAALVTAGAIHDELRMRYFETQRRPLLRRIVKDFDRRELPRRRRRELMIREFHKQQLEWQAEGWDMAHRLQLGLALIEIFAAATGLVEEVMIFERKNRTVRYLSFTEEMRKVISERMEESANLFTVYYPTVVPPRPWTNSALIGGGYYTDDVKPYRFVKGSKVNYLSELENTDLSQVISAVNALQETAWRVNPVMLEVLTEVFHRNMGVKGVPTADPVAVPPPPPGVDQDEEIKAAYMRDCYIVHDTNRRDISKRISLIRTISLAQRFAAYEAIYFPHDLDSRGRAYPKVPFLNPQGADYAKSLLEFARGKSIDTAEQEAYLAIAIANAWGQDKLPLQERVQWVEENEVMLQEVALDPLGDLRWLAADDPFMALRGALEWRGLCEAGPGYVSHMPIHFDATCSGLQHFSALLRDEEGGFYVNLTANPERQDIYAEVAAKATASLTEDGSLAAKVALEMGVTRALCKRPVMIVPYSGTFNACLDYVNDHYRELAEGGEVLPLSLKEIRTEITPLVAKHVWEAISSTVIKARAAMDWITSAAREVCKHTAAPIQWTTPDGFTVQQAKFKSEEKRVNTYFDGGRAGRKRYSLVIDTAKLDGRQMAQSLSPNFIHSMDACHMRASINRALALGDMSFAMIHDSFGVHAADMAVFARECIRPAFVEMYRGRDNLEKFRRELLVNIPGASGEELRPVPKPGSLDLEEVLGSEFFFS